MLEDERRDSAELFWREKCEKSFAQKTALPELEMLDVLEYGSLNFVAVLDGIFNSSKKFTRLAQVVESIHKHIN